MVKGEVSNWAVDCFKGLTAANGSMGLLFSPFYPKLCLAFPGAVYLGSFYSVFMTVQQSQLWLPETQWLNLT